ncbi:methionyl aminopeptidase [Prauserella flava]|uniref:Methionine aminopeptidase n=2 Tax=Prauserella salsuginis group TaxID=2893672 RepID=A0A839XHA3_9PSEU|nr:methionyl aminopeptidase [Prauserella sediminis]MCR3719822.1 methionyl aminopeptidase [Prauserella flava]MCR3736635.1 methionyl aminopeptidase [Prauserella salsuginis]
MNLLGLRMPRWMRRGGSIETKSRGELEAMRAAGLIVSRTLAAVTDAAKPGVSTLELDALAEQLIRDADAVPSFKGYHGFPGSICASVNDQIVHGIPSSELVLADGDLLSVDCGAILEGWHGDSAVTISVGEVSEPDGKLSAATKAAMQAGIDAALPGSRLTDISHAIEMEALGKILDDGIEYGMIEEYGGHGIGREMHMEPFLPNVGKPGRGPELRPGVTLAIEPMLTGGSGGTVELDDGWTVITDDGSRAAHWEHTVAVTEDGPWVLTAPESASAE